MKPRKSYWLPILAALALLAIATYELYWLRGLYDTKREAIEREIRISVTWAEMNELSHRRKNPTDSIFITIRRNKGGLVQSARVVTMKFAAPGDSVASAISVSKLDEPLNLPSLLGVLSDIDLNLLDSVLTERLDSIGLPVAHRLDLAQGDEIVASVGTEGYATGKSEDIFSITSIANSGIDYSLHIEPIAGYIIRGMGGILLASFGILLILGFVFCLMMRSLRKQRELDEMKSDFTSNMTHEFKTPIAVAYAANDAMLVYGLDKNPDKREEYLKVTRDSLEKLNGIVEQILSMTMENRERLVLQKKETPLLPILEAAARHTRLSAGKPCTLTVSIEPEDLSADIDPALISSVIATLLDNAVKYSLDSVEIGLAAFRQGEHTCITVSDNGIGIAPDKQPHIFEKFYRIPTGNIHDIKGYGIGFFFAKTIVEKHSGHISVHSTPGKGSTFSIELPDVPRHARLDRASSYSGERCHSERSEESTSHE